ncbi:DNA-cytosine methyltransferase [Desulfonema limicola]|uniref:Cytosine-specific methyltransferase n=2 Tax=Desulfonema limicola TaxID=45656 RepID=A0A975B6F3_9BACT|nr:DNA-cytosine methyltransferase [Desulfonema limicola]
MIMKKKYTYIDLFAGCGGLSLGLLNSGWTGVFAIEKNCDAFETLDYNLIKKKEHYEWPTWLPKKNHDINQVLNNNRKNLIKLKGKIDLVAGGPPCQGFSYAGRRKENDERNKLIDSYLNFIELVKPKFIFFENVKGFTLEFKNNNEIGKNYSFDVIKKLCDLGYNIHGRLIDFSKYGVPQRRTRFILVGVQKEFDKSDDMPKLFFEILEKNKFDFLKNKGLTDFVTLEEAISDLLEENGTASCPDSIGFKSAKYSNAKTSFQKYLRDGILKESIPDSHRLVNHSQEIKKRFQYAIDNNLGPKEYRTHFNLSKTGTKKLSADDPAPTLTTLPDDYIHYQEPRVFTVREFARIQSFPDWYEFKGRYTTGGKLRVKQVPRYTQVGNAVPPLFAEIVGQSFKEIINA